MHIQMYRPTCSLVDFLRKKTCFHGYIPQCLRIRHRIVQSAGQLSTFRLRMVRRWRYFVLAWQSDWSCSIQVSRDVSGSNMWRYSAQFHPYLKSVCKDVHSCQHHSFLTIHMLNVPMLTLEEGLKMTRVRKILIWKVTEVASSVIL